jgi:carboxyl-terminal processing protease
MSGLRVLGCEMHDLGGRRHFRCPAVAGTSSESIRLTSWRPAIALVVAAALSACVGSAPQPSPSSTTTTFAAGDWVSYVGHAIAELQRFYYWTADVDWEEVRDDALSDVTTDPTKSGAYNAIWSVLAGLRGGHQRFVVPGPVTEERLAPSSPPPRGTRIGDYGYLYVPTLPGFNEQYGTYATVLHEAMRSITADGPVCGWVVDLRENFGGIMQPMLLGVAPLLGPGVFLSYEGPTARYDWSYRSGQLLMNGTVFDDEMLDQIMSPGPPFEGLPDSGRGGLHVESPFVSPDPSVPVAVLFGGGAPSSAGEGVLVSFLGRDNTRTFASLPSAGNTDFGEVVIMPDGALLVITSAHARDRLGRPYEGSISPDELIIDTMSRPLLDAALDWLAATSGCPSSAGA